jgi:hypothetical protein
MLEFWEYRFCVGRWDHGVMLGRHERATTPSALMHYEVTVGTVLHRG